MHTVVDLEILRGCFWLKTNKKGFELQLHTEVSLTENSWHTHLVLVLSPYDNSLINYEAILFQKEVSMETNATPVSAIDHM